MHLSEGRSTAIFSYQDLLFRFCMIHWEIINPMSSVFCGALFHETPKSNIEDDAYMILTL